MRTPTPVQTKRVGPEGSEQTAAPPIVQEVLASHGQPLDPATRDLVESRFDRDFSDVRIHADAKAAKSADSVNALAYTVGHHIAFGAGQYAPGTESGRKLMAHELTHVMQQATAGSRSATPLLQRRVVGIAGRASDIEFTVGREISVALAKKAKAAAAGRSRQRNSAICTRRRSATARSATTSACSWPGCWRPTTPWRSRR